MLLINYASSFSIFTITEYLETVIMRKTSYQILIKYFSGKLIFS